MYSLRRSAKSNEKMAPEEVDVLAALKLYTDNTEDGRADLFDFVSTKVLYERYIKHYDQWVDTWDAPERLSIRQFGAALRRVFPELESDETRRVRRRYAGRMAWGYIGMKGPESIRLHKNPGRPKVKHGDDETAPAPADLQREVPLDSGPTSYSAGDEADQPGVQSSDGSGVHASVEENPE